MSAHDTSTLQDLGKRRKRIKAQLDELDAALTPEIQAAAAAQVQQVDIIEWTGLTRETVRLKSMSDEQREAERVKRRNKKVS